MSYQKKTESWYLFNQSLIAIQYIQVRGQTTAFFRVVVFPDGGKERFSRDYLLLERNLATGPLALARYLVVNDRLWFGYIYLLVLVKFVYDDINLLKLQSDHHDTFPVVTIYNIYTKFHHNRIIIIVYELI